MRLPPPEVFRVTANDDRNLVANFVQLGTSVDLTSIGPPLSVIPSDTGCYLWVMQCGEARYKIYLGRTGSIRKRARDYSREFQVHSPNDFKLRLFQSFMAKSWPAAKLDLYF